MKEHIVYIYHLKKEPIFDAINQFSVVNSKYPKGGALGYYSEEAYKVGVLFSNVKTSFGSHAVLGTIWVQFGYTRNSTI